MLFQHRLVLLAGVSVFQHKLGVGNIRHFVVMGIIIVMNVLIRILPDSHSSSEINLPCAHTISVGWVAAGLINFLIISNLQRYIAAAAEGLGQNKQANLVPASIYVGLSQIKHLGAADRPGLYPNRYTDNPIR